MPNWVHSAAFRLVVAFAMTLGMLLSPAGSSVSHDPIALVAAEAARHAKLAGQIETHGHVHDDGATEDQGPGHSHGHNPADHSHETANTLLDFAPAVPATGRNWVICPPSFPEPEASSRLDRPPRPILAG
ncbi:hypothetical protein [Mesorhizobium sophorae]|uniref:hypothetical protein n=1 Tax=Mesorhizobium sophorae TaxID=1300294 RepID=UPI000BA4007C|nr:hypothetical protein [Mesorhizobium sophorae]